MIFVGPRLKSEFGKTCIGGGTVLYEHAISVLPKGIDVINSNYDCNFWPKKLLFNIFLFIRLSFKKERLIIFAAHRQARYSFILNVILKKNITLRLIGGNYDHWFKSAFDQFLLKKLNQSNFKLYTELEKDVMFFKSFGIHSYKQENFRKKPKNISKETQNKTSIALIGRLNKSKGLHVFLELAKILPEIDFLLLGPVDEPNFDLKKIENISNLKYCKPLDNEQINTELSRIKILFFHSEHKGEGKPGIIVESIINNVQVVTNYLVQDEDWKILYEKNILNYCNGSLESYREKVLEMYHRPRIEESKIPKIFDAELNIKKLIS